MPFPKPFAEFAARTRVAVGFAVAATFLWLASPTAESLGVGGAAVAFGLVLRGWAAGHLRKNQELARSGPFAYVRNPLYLGTLISGTGFAVAGAQPTAGLALVAFFALWYLPVVEEEERHLRTILPGYAEYERRVPRLLPALRPRHRSTQGFRLALYRSNREYEALFGCAALMAVLVFKALR